MAYQVTKSGNSVTGTTS
ncbi:hypothetical protein [Streptomyces sp. NPDC051001]